MCLADELEGQKQSEQGDVPDTLWIPLEQWTAFSKIRRVVRKEALGYCVHGVLLSSFSMYLTSPVYI